MRQNTHPTSQPLVIAGSCRSGTTWVLDALAESNGLRTVFEPLNPLGIKAAAPFANRCLPGSADHAGLRQFMDRVFSGHFRSIWANTRFTPASLRPDPLEAAAFDYLYHLAARYRTFLRRYLRYLAIRRRRPITKFIRANLMIDWLEKNFNARVVLIVRHPGAVVASKIAGTREKGGMVWDFNGPVQQQILERYTRDRHLDSAYPRRFREIFSRTLSPAAGHAAMWCLENLLPLHRAAHNGARVFFYEDMLRHPRREYERMAATLGLENSPDLAAVARPSQQTFSAMKKKTFDQRQLTRWMDRLDEAQHEDLARVLDFFNVSVYTADNPMPVKRTQDLLS